MRRVRPERGLGSPWASMLGGRSASPVLDAAPPLWAPPAPTMPSAAVGGRSPRPHGKSPMGSHDAVVRQSGVAQATETPTR